MGNAYSEGIYCPPPPCMYNKCMYNFFSENCFCKIIGSCGSSWADKNRSKIFFVASIFSFISLILLATCLVSLSSNKNAIKAVPFMYGLISPDGVDDFHFYNGVVSIYLHDAPGSLTEIKNWQDVDCSSTEVFNESTCKDCKTASFQATQAIVIGFISQFPQIFTDLCRSKAKNDLNCLKLIGIVTGIIGFLSTMVALAGYSSNCYSKIDSSYGTTDVDKQLGPAFFLLLIATLLKLVDVIAHSLVPTPKEGYFGSEALIQKSIVV